MQRISRSRVKVDVQNPDDVIEIGFLEPVLADTNIVTGQRMEDPPSIKIKKELGAFTKNSSILKDSKKSLEGNDDNCLKNYEKNLKSQTEIENSTIFSNIRSSSLKRSKRDTDDTAAELNREMKKSNRGANTSIKKNNKSKTSGNTKSHPFLDVSKDLMNELKDSQSSTIPDPTALNNDYCSCCGMTGMFLCCESCPKSYHFQCLNPPIDSNNLPDFWYCKECIKKKSLSNDINNNKKSSPSIMLNVGIYGKLFDNIIFQDPISFQLPKEIIESFQGISIDRLGDYNDDSFKPIKSYKQLIKEFDDPLNGKYDKNDNPIFCYFCGDSGFNKEIINCDYCSLSWHLDCLDPPITSVKKLGSKWKCPNHIDDLDVPIRKFKDQKIVPVSNIENFENFGKLPINANLEIVNIEDKLENLKNDIKLLHDNSNNHLKFSNLTFQINEEDIILNFINSSKVKKLNENDQNLQHLMNLKPNLKDYVLSLSKLSKKSFVDDDFKLLNLQKLLKITDDELKIENKDFTHDEIKEFLMIKKLIEKKGKDKLLKFLNS